jgi:hypothetical protein
MRCNRCTLNEARKLAKMCHLTLTTRPHVVGSWEGIDVLMHEPQEEPDHERHFVAWFMALPDHCVCEGD